MRSDCGARDTPRRSTSTPCESVIPLGMGAQRASSEPQGNGIISIRRDDIAGGGRQQSPDVGRLQLRNLVGAERLVAHLPDPGQIVTDIPPAAPKALDASLRTSPAAWWASRHPRSRSHGLRGCTRSHDRHGSAPCPQSSPGHAMCCPCQSHSRRHLDQVSPWPRSGPGWPPGRLRTRWTAAQVSGERWATSAPSGKASWFRVVVLISLDLESRREERRLEISPEEFARDVRNRVRGRGQGHRVTSPRFPLHLTRSLGMEVGRWRGKLKVPVLAVSYHRCRRRKHT